MKLTGPASVSLSLQIDGETYQVANGTVTPEIPDGKVPNRLYGLGFTQAQKPSKKPNPSVDDAQPVGVQS